MARATRSEVVGEREAELATHACDLNLRSDVGTLRSLAVEYVNVCL
jgi:hypothetical protein